MPDVPDIPGKGIVVGVTKRAAGLAAGAGKTAVGVCGSVAKRVLGGGENEKGAKADPIAETPTAPPGAERKPTPKPKPAKPKAVKPKPAKPESAKPAPKPKAAKPKPAKPKGPHSALNNPVGEPDETEYPDPYEKRPDPRDPVDPDGEPFGEEPHPATGAESTSEPPLEIDPEVGDRAKPPKRENLDD
ncbi:MAG TPA: hypothetical protein VGI17_00725 [Solirubrobacterales bacterium]|jgi:hypothetical protein